jgi:hypothetical protein
VERETRKLLGKLTDGEVKLGGFAVSAHCNRVFVEDGHTETISVTLKNQATIPEMIEAWRAYRSVPQERNLPSAPKHPIIVREERDRPQPKFDIGVEHGTQHVVRDRPGVLELNRKADGLAGRPKIDRAAPLDGAVSRTRRKITDRDRIAAGVQLRRDGGDPDTPDNIEEFAFLELSAAA